MPWESRAVKDQREEFVQAAMECSNFSALCREFRITRRTGLKWRARYAAQEPLSDRSRRPKQSPMRTPEPVERRILELRAENPGWGARTLHQVLTNQGVKDLPCVKTVNNILNRHGCISPEEAQKRRPYIRYEKERCNMMWQTDFKGEFRMADGNYCYPLTILDDHSRYALGIFPHLSTKNVVIPAFTELFQQYGLPDSILSDNGAQFAGFRKGFTQFERWLMELDILPIHGRIKHPQTQGKIERFHRTMKQELLNHTDIADITDAGVQFSRWNHKYNYVRPHVALGMKTPGDVYTPSSRVYPDKIQPWVYSGEYHVVKVNSWGYARFDKWQVYLSETMSGHHIEFRPSPDGESFFACYRNFKIAEFNTQNGELIRRIITRL